jgi:hypothetical protein
MAQLFHPSMNTVAKASIFGAVFAALIAFTIGYEVQASPWLTNQGVHRDQPIPFSHEHHVRGLGIDCRYCHGGVEDSAFAGIPPTKTCMTCHSKIWTDAALLQPVRDSWSTGVPIAWNRVNNLPHFAYFNHSVHVNKGVGCVTCHGQVDQMPLMYQYASLQMEWCLHCHRDPGKVLRPRQFEFDVNYDLGQPQYLSQVQKILKDDTITAQDKLGEALIQLYHIPTDGRLTNCSTCHR